MKSSIATGFDTLSVTDIVNSYLSEMESLLDLYLDQNCEVKQDINIHSLARDFNHLRGLWMLARSAGAHPEQLAFFQRDMKRINLYLYTHKAS